jgi:hypothetical protein
MNKHKGEKFIRDFNTEHDPEITVATRSWNSNKKNQTFTDISHNTTLEKAIKTLIFETENGNDPSNF